MPPSKDLTGKKFNMLTVLHKDTSKELKAPYWICRCECGNEKSILGYSITNGVSKSCGCLQSKMSSEKKLIDLVGKKFGRWTVLSRAENYPNGNPRWNCVCDCGTPKIVDGYSLSSGRTTSCGCHRKEVISSLKTLDLTGQVFSHLTVLNRDTSVDNTHASWVCECSCGNTVSVLSYNLQNGNSKSCGCYGRELASIAMTTHGLSHTPTHKSWSGLKERCNNPKNPAYHHYGGRGITVCDRWMESFENFLEDMGVCPPNMSIDRIDVNGNYTPENCRWATWTEQGRNKRDTIYLVYKGERRPLCDWADLLGIPQDSLRSSVSRFGDEEGIRRCISRHGKAA